MDNNVIVFPKHKKNHPPQSLEEIQDDINSMRMNKAEDIVSSCMIGIADSLAVAGVDIMDPDVHENLKYNTWVLEAIRLLVYKKLGLDHPWSTIVEDIFNVEKHQEYTDLNVVTWEYNDLKVEKDNGFENEG